MNLTGPLKLEYTSTYRHFILWNILKLIFYLKGGNFTLKSQNEIMIEHIVKLKIMVRG